MRNEKDKMAEEARAAAAKAAFSDDSFCTDESLKDEELLQLKEDILLSDRAVEGMRLRVMTLEAQATSKDARLAEQISQIRRLNGEFLKLSQAQNKKLVNHEEDSDTESAGGLRDKIESLEKQLVRKDDRIQQAKDKCEELKEKNRKMKKQMKQLLRSGATGMAGRLSVKSKASSGKSHGRESVWKADSDDEEGENLPKGGQNIRGHRGGSMKVVKGKPEPADVLKLLQQKRNSILMPRMSHLGLVEALKEKAEAADLAARGNDNDDAS